MPNCHAAAGQLSLIIIPPHYLPISDFKQFHSGHLLVAEVQPDLEPIMVASIEVWQANERARTIRVASSLTKVTQDRIWCCFDETS